MEGTRTLSAAQLIRHEIDQFAPGELICTRQFLHIGSRSAVDTELWRSVNDGSLTRIVNGVFARPPTGDEVIEPPSAREVAEIKARAFGKTIVSDHADAARQFELTTQDEKGEIVFRVSGRTSQFRFNGTYIYLRAASRRKIQLGDSTLGKLLRALWYLGETECERSQPQIEAKLIKAASITNRRIAGWIPWWLHRFVENLCPLALPRVNIARA
ncbi:MAG TPA: DUF6088 family protein [Planktothrix sp.]